MLRQVKRVPYVKVVSDVAKDKKGNPLVLNPITKNQPYLHPIVRKQPTNSSNNKKGARVVVVNYGKGLFIKYHVREQLVSNGHGGFKTIYHYVEKRKLGHNGQLTDMSRKKVD